jgi:hypothetical protein
MRVLFVFVGLVCSTFAFADRPINYQVTITNITKGQTFTPTLVATHDRSLSVFRVGTPASLPLEILAEAGDTGPLADDLLSRGRAVSDVKTIPGLLGPGQTASVIVGSPRLGDRISIAAMLIPTNDNFYALNGADLPAFGEATYEVPAYDAGTEENDQACAQIPGPRCGGEGHSPGTNPGDEGFVFIGSGFHDLGTEDAQGGEVLQPAQYDWRNPVARITVRRMK